jgi:hypothetical protein
VEHATRQAARERRSSRPVIASLLLPGASLPNPRSRGGAPANVVEEARLNREARALRKVDRPERKATEKSHRQQVEREEELRERRFSDFGDDERAT